MTQQPSEQQELTHQEAMQQEEMRQQAMREQRRMAYPYPPRRQWGCLRGCLVSVLIYFALCIIIGVIIGIFFPSSSVELKKNTIYHLEMKGTLVEQAQEENPLEQIFGSMQSLVAEEKTVGLNDILANIELAKNDDKVLGIWLDGGQMSMTPAGAKAIRDALIDFKSSGKWVVASAVHYGASNYYVATAADVICLDPSGDVSWNGLSAQQMYFTRLLEKIGVEMQILKVGTFKSAVEPYFRTSMSEEDKLQTLQYLNGIWDEYKTAVSASRHIPVEQLDSLADRYMGLQPAEEQLAAGLVDTIIYHVDMDKMMRTYAGTKDYHLMSTKLMAQVERTTSSTDEKIAVYYLEGTIVDEGNDGIVAKKVVKTMKEIEKDDDIKAVVLRVNSPGGSAEASEHIWRAVERIKESGKPVVVSMGGLAASGGYYISCGADYIYAEPTTLTGSIGIFGTVPNFAELRDKVGLDVDGVATNKYSALESNMIFKGMNEEERQLMQTMVERGYDLFTRRCAEGRNIPQDSIKVIGEGRVWLGAKAMELGLVDEMGNINKAINKAAKLAKLNDYQIAYYPEQKDFMDELMKEMMGGEPTEEEKIILKIREFASKPRIMAIMPLVEIK